MKPMDHKVEYKIKEGFLQLYFYLVYPRLGFLKNCLVLYWEN